MHFNKIHLTRFSMLAVLISLLTTSWCVSPAKAHPTADAMAKAAQWFQASLDDEQQKKTMFEFDGKQRTAWHFIPKDRAGLSLKEMRADQQQLFYGLLLSAHSHAGFQKSLQIMSLEQILHEMENNAPHRDPQRYHIYLFGEPSPTKTWGWRIEGHHLSVNFTIVDGQKVAPTPSFFGSNPAEVREGPRKGLRVLGTEEDLARQLVRSLEGEAGKAAILSNTAPADIVNGPGRDAGPLDPKGISAREFNPKQMRLLKHLVRVYVNRLRFPLAKDEIAKIEKAGFENIHVAWAGSLERGEPHYYRVQGPAFMLEYDNTQNDANHVHLIWRDFHGDFGADLLKEHYDEHHP